MAAAGRFRRTPAPPKPREAEKPTRKNHYLYQSKIDLAREILGVETETAALDAALDLLIYGEMMARGTEAMAGEEYKDVLGIAGDVPDAAAEG
jgi:ribosomal protein S30